MSLVQAIITKDFILVGADKRGMIIEDKIINEECNKMIKLNKGIIFACTGGIKDNYKLFKDYCNYSDEVGLMPLEREKEVSYSEFVKRISTRYQEMSLEHNNDENLRTYDIHSIICGYNGEEFEITAFSLGAKKGMVDGIYKIHKTPDFIYRGVNLGEEMHMEMLHELVGITYHKFGKVTMLQYKNIILEVFEKGSKLDETINTNVCFERIKKNAVLNE